MTTSQRPWRVDIHNDNVILAGNRTVAMFHSPGDAAYAVSAVNAHNQPPDVHTAEQLRNIDRKLVQIMTQASDNQAAIDADVAQLNKALGEIRGALDALNASIVDLQAQVAAGGTVDLTALTAASQALDDVVPDAPAV